MSSAALCTAERRVESACVSVDKPLAALVDYGCVNLSLEPACKLPGATRVVHVWPTQ